MILRELARLARETRPAQLAVDGACAFLGAAVGTYWFWVATEASHERLYRMFPH